jgi:predicted phage terminase large subunit-like protein
MNQQVMIDPNEAMRIIQENVPAMDQVGQEAILKRLNWLQTARPNQIIPEEKDWIYCGALAGRGFGKTRMGAEWAWWQSWSMPKSFGAIIAPTRYDAQSVCIEGPAGILACCPSGIIKNYNKSELKITLMNGSTMQGFSSSEPDRLRGPQHHWAWCDELAAWENGDEVWDMLQFGMRLGDMPQTIWTTTPRPTPTVRRMVNLPNTILIRGSTFDNEKNLPASFFENLTQYNGTKIGRQELMGELLDTEEGGIIKREWINLWPRNQPVPPFQMIVVSFDTAFTEKTLSKKGHDPDPTACSVWGYFDHDGMVGFLLLDCWEDHLGFPDLVERAKKEMQIRWGDDEFRAVIKPKFGSSKPYNMGRKPDHLLIEDKGSGISLRQVLYREGIFPIAYNPGRASKLQRLHAVSHLFHSGLIYVVESKKMAGAAATWTEELISQLCSFQGEGSIRHDDYVDSTTQALRWMMDNVRLSVTEQPEDDEPPPKQVVNPYAL